MKKYLFIATIILAIISCKSGDSKDNTDKDSLNINTPTSFDQLKETDLNHVGDLSLGMKMNAVVEKLGEPEVKSKEEEWAADGWIHQDWGYKAKGIYLNMTRDKDSSAMEVFSISITNPCPFKTKKNVGIGSTYDEVMTTYAQEIDKTSSDENVVTVGSLYGGIIFEFSNKKVSKIFVGAAAE